jgi:oligopeptide transport system permease protein
MTETKFDAQAFEPLAKGAAAEVITRPSLSYWQDAWRRLKDNRRAVISLWIIIGLLAFTLIGPLLWTVDHAKQNVDKISERPFTSTEAVLTTPLTPWDTDNLSRPNDSLALATPATTQTARLVWQAMPTASAYRIYRNIFPYAAGEGLGLPLGETFSPTHTYFEDRLDLQAKTYYYTVVALDSQLHETDQVATLEVPIVRVISLAEATDRGLLKEISDGRLGEKIHLGTHPFGTDYLGRDLLARLMEGARVSLFIGIVAPFLFVFVGVAYGSIAGFLGGASDQVLMRFADFVVALPFLLFMILFKIAFGIGPGESGVMPMLLALVLLSWPSTARLVRGQILQIREEGYISAAQLLGAKTGYLVLRHMIPNTLGVILVTLTFAVPSAIFTEAFLSFIGMGVAPPTPSWGSMCNEGIKTMLTSPHELIFPALFISVTVLAFNLLGDGLRDALDSRMRSRE